MPATGHKWDRFPGRFESWPDRTLLLALAGCILLAAACISYAKAPESVSSVIGSLGEELSSGNAPAFLTHFDRAMPGYDRLQADVYALVDQADIASSIEISKDEGDDQHRVVELDWEMEITGKSEAGEARVRHQEIHCRLERRDKGWKIVSFDPVDFFAVPRPAPNS